MPNPCFQLAVLVLGTIVALEDLQRLLWTIFDTLLGEA